MLLSIKLSDNTYEKYGKINPQNPRIEVERIAERFAGFPVSSKHVFLTGEVLSSIQKLLGASVDTPEGLEALIKKAVSVKVDGVDVPLTPSQLKGVQDNAAFYKQDPAKYAEQKIKQGLVSALGV